MFWETLRKPIIASAPMDGVSDAAFRYIMDTMAHPPLLMTEFTSVEGIAKGIPKLLDAFIHHKTNTPTIAQIFGSHPDAFAIGAHVAAEMGFDGVDINMGCPDTNVAKRGGGAALINTPDLAKTIITTVKQSLKDWSEGKTMIEAKVPETIQSYISIFQKKFDIIPERRSLPVSVKTRIGFYVPVTEAWIQNLLEAEPAAITLHGRTLKQMYTGLADWEEIGKAAAIVKQTKTVFLGNGDIHSLEEAEQKIKQYQLDGVLIGRASLGNPWLFLNIKPTVMQRMETCILHCQKFTEYCSDMPFHSLRKHLAWYCKEFDGSRALKDQLMHVNTLLEVENVLKPFMTEQSCHG